MLKTDVKNKFLDLNETKRKDLLMTHCVRDVQCAKRLNEGALLTEYPHKGAARSFSTIPWFGLDIGGTLAKLVYFVPDSSADTDSSDRSDYVEIERYLENSTTYGDTGKRDTHLEMHRCKLGGQSGTLHFIHFTSTEIFSFLDIAKSKGIAAISTTICATGGGAQFLDDHLGEVELELRTEIYKYDELESLLRGIHYIESCSPFKECFYFDIDIDLKTYTKTPFDFSNAFPYLVVNIGSGVSMLAVDSPTEYRRITGTSLGGGTFLGLCCLLTGCESFEEAIELAEKGDSGTVDKLVKDIYGGDYPKFNLRADTVASSFGNMGCRMRREQASREDLARATLTSVTNNIASIARMCALNEGMSRIVFVGNFLRYNVLSMHMLAYAMDFWSHGNLKALFLEHEGYFGAIGCIVEHLRSLEESQ